jgi:hypothetical protein
MKMKLKTLPGTQEPEHSSPAVIGINLSGYGNASSPVVPLAGVGTDPLAFLLVKRGI